MKVKTRSSTSHATFGTPLPELPACQLPTQLHVCRHLLKKIDSKVTKKWLQLSVERLCLSGKKEICQRNHSRLLIETSFV